MHRLFAPLILALALLAGCDSRKETPLPADSIEAADAPAESPTPTASRHDRPAGPPRPAMWKIADDDTTIFLFGGVHMLPPGLDWQSGMVESAVKSADTLVLELSPQEQVKAPAVLANLAANTPQLPLDQRLPPDLEDELTELADRAHLNRMQLDAMESWAVALLLSNVVSRDANLSLDEGTEKQLTVRFQQMGKAVEGLETIDYQLGLFDGLPQPTQDRLLARTVGDADAAAGKFDKLVAAWAAGDTDAVALYADSELRAVEGLSGALLTDRNRQWATWLQNRLARPGTILVAVGAGHLVGTDSVQAMLEAQGVPVKRVQ